MSALNCNYVLVMLSKIFSVSVKAMLHNLCLNYEIMLQFFFTQKEVEKKKVSTQLVQKYETFLYTTAL